MYVSSHLANIYASDSRLDETTSQALFGERVTVLGQNAHYSKVRLENDGYSGYVENQNLSDSAPTSTHRVHVRSTPAFIRPDIKSPVLKTLLLGSELSLTQSEHEQFMQSDTGAFIWQSHVRTLLKHSTGSLVDTAEQFFLGAPYLWGGRSPLGLDCSSLVQLSAMLHGWQIPRDTKDQVPFFEVGASVENNKKRSGLSMPSAMPVVYHHLQKNDLVYWPGHVAIMRNATEVTHATAHSLSCCSEKLEAVEQRAGKPTSLWRLRDIE